LLFPGADKSRLTFRKAADDITVGSFRDHSGTVLTGIQQMRKTSGIRNLPKSLAGSDLEKERRLDGLQIRAGQLAAKRRPTLP